MTLPRATWDWRLLAFVGPATIAVLTRVLTGPHTIDDAYITFRYARNLATGLGLVYNPGEWVLGTTAPLWAIVLGGGYHLGLTDLPWLATGVSAVCDALTVVWLVGFSLRLGWPALGAGLVGLAWAVNPMSIAFATGGMETSLFICVAMSVLALTASEARPYLATAQPKGGGARLVVAAVVAGVATLLRPEGVLLLATVVAWTFVVRRRRTWLVAICGGVPIAAAGLLLWWRYGSPLPNSVAAKQVAYVAVSPFENAIALLVQAGLPGWSTYFLGVVPPGVGLVIAACGLLALIELIRRSLPWLEHRHVPWQPFAGFGMLYIVFYVVVGLRGVRLFPWYLVPLAPLYLLGAAAGLLAAGRGLTRWKTLPIVWLAAVLVVWQLPAIDWHRAWLPSGDDLGREQVLLDAGHLLAGSLAPTAVIAAPEIGALGYSSNLRMLDTVGLVSPRALAYYPLAPDQLVADNAIPPRLILDARPDAVVTLDAFAQRSLAPDLAFQGAYRLDSTYPAQVWQSQALLIFRRVDGP